VILKTGKKKNKTIEADTTGKRYITFGKTGHPTVGGKLDTAAISSWNFLLLFAISQYLVRGTLKGILRYSLPCKTNKSTAN
jgi:hypothetical protein